MTLRITKSLTGEVVRWEPRAGSSILVGFLDADHVFRPTHPHLDAYDGQPWGDNVEDAVRQLMREAGT